MLLRYGFLLFLCFHTVQSGVLKDPTPGAHSGDPDQFVGSKTVDTGGPKTRPGDVQIDLLVRKGSEDVGITVGDSKVDIVVGGSDKGKTNTVMDKGSMANTVMDKGSMANTLHDKQASFDTRTSGFGSRTGIDRTLESGANFETGIDSQSTSFSDEMTMTGGQNRKKTNGGTIFTSEERRTGVGGMKMVGGQGDGRTFISETGTRQERTVGGVDPRSSFRSETSVTETSRENFQSTDSRKILKGGMAARTTDGRSLTSGGIRVEGGGKTITGVGKNVVGHDGTSKTVGKIRMTGNQGGTATFAGSRTDSTRDGGTSGKIITKTSMESKSTDGGTLSGRGMTVEGDRGKVKAGGMTAVGSDGTSRSMGKITMTGTRDSTATITDRRTDLSAESFSKTTETRDSSSTFATDGPVGVRETLRKMALEKLAMTTGSQEGPHPIIDGSKTQWGDTTADRIKDGTMDRVGDTSGRIVTQGSSEARWGTITPDRSGKGSTVGSGDRFDSNTDRFKATGEGLKTVGQDGTLRSGGRITITGGEGGTATITGRRTETTGESGQTSTTTGRFEGENMIGDKIAAVGFEKEGARGKVTGAAFKTTGPDGRTDIQTGMTMQGTGDREFKTTRTESRFTETSSTRETQTLRDREPLSRIGDTTGRIVAKGGFEGKTTDGDTVSGRGFVVKDDSLRATGVGVKAVGEDGTTRSGGKITITGGEGGRATITGRRTETTGDRGQTSSTTGRFIGESRVGDKIAAVGFEKEGDRGKVQGAAITRTGPDGGTVIRSGMTIQGPGDSEFKTTRTESRFTDTIGTRETQTFRDREPLSRIGDTSGRIVAKGGFEGKTTDGDTVSGRGFVVKDDSLMAKGVGAEAVGEDGTTRSGGKITITGGEGGRATITGRKTETTGDSGQTSSTTGRFIGESRVGDKIAAVGFEKEGDRGKVQGAAIKRTGPDDGTVIRSGMTIQGPGDSEFKTTRTESRFTDTSSTRETQTFRDREPLSRIGDTTGRIVAKGGFEGKTTDGDTVSGRGFVVKDDSLMAKGVGAEAVGQDGTTRSGGKITITGGEGGRATITGRRTETTGDSGQTSSTTGRFIGESRVGDKIAAVGFEKEGDRGKVTGAAIKRTGPDGGTVIRSGMTIQGPGDSEFKTTRTEGRFTDTSSTRESQTFRDREPLSRIGDTTGRIVAKGGFEGKTTDGDTVSGRGFVVKDDSLRATGVGVKAVGEDGTTRSGGKITITGGEGGRATITGRRTETTGDSGQTSSTTGRFIGESRVGDKIAAVGFEKEGDRGKVTGAAIKRTGPDGGTVIRSGMTIQGPGDSEFKTTRTEGRFTDTSSTRETQTFRDREPFSRIGDTTGRIVTKGDSEARWGTITPDRSGKDSMTRSGGKITITGGEGGTATITGSRTKTTGESGQTSTTTGRFIGESREGDKIAAVGFEKEGDRGKVTGAAVRTTGPDGGTVIRSGMNIQGPGDRMLKTTRTVDKFSETSRTRESSSTFDSSSTSRVEGDGTFGGKITVTGVKGRDSTFGRLAAAGGDIRSDRRIADDSRVMKTTMQGSGDQGRFRMEGGKRILIGDQAGTGDSRLDSTKTGARFDSFDKTTSIESRRGRITGSRFEGESRSEGRLGGGFGGTTGRGSTEGGSSGRIEFTRTITGRRRTDTGGRIPGIAGGRVEFEGELFGGIDRALQRGAFIYNVREVNASLYCWRCDREFCDVPHRDECFSYVMCIRTANPTETRPAQYVAIAIECPHGTMWDYRAYTCVHPEKPDTCENERCQDPNMFAYEHPDGNCKTFWQCVDGVSRGSCCGVGMEFNSTLQMCVNSTACYDTCPRLDQSVDKCNTDLATVSHDFVDGNCRTYWKCENTWSVGACCDFGERYDVDYGCVTDETCREQCPPGFGSSGEPCSDDPSVRAYRHANSSRSYWKCITEPNGRRRPYPVCCPNDYYFDSDQQTCLWPLYPRYAPWDTSEPCLNGFFDCGLEMGSNSSYWVQMGTDMERKCANGTRFDEKTCHCAEIVPNEFYDCYISFIFHFADRHTLTNDAERNWNEVISDTRVGNQLDAIRLGDFDGYSAIKLQKMDHNPMNEIYLELSFENRGPRHPNGQRPNGLEPGHLPNGQGRERQTLFSNCRTDRFVNVLSPSIDISLVDDAQGMGRGVLEIMANNDTHTSRPDGKNPENTYVILTFDYKPNTKYHLLVIYDGQMIRGELRELGEFWRTDLHNIVPATQVQLLSGELYRSEHPAMIGACKKGRSGALVDGFNGHIDLFAFAKCVPQKFRYPN